ncbi:MAG: MCE family protein [Winogradskyella sp.]|uniref:MlaD family protein n=1 Tax=Winogradskyella sp. TaxID=1883156 RepID=UPI0025F336E2|nr:MlaD family protein [Winogradskyella sp.]NRB58977.1 MCE family protein [Winogradskyella sp.]
MKITREAKTGILVLSGIALFIYLFSFLKGDDLFTSKDVFYTEFDYNALSSSSPVTVKGNKVGKIESIDYMYDTGKTRVTFSVNKKLKFSKNSTISLYATGIMGGNALEIIDANDGKYANPGDVLTSGVKKSLISSLESELPKVTEGLGGTLSNTDVMVANLNKLLTDESDDGLQHAISELNKTLKSYNSVAQSIETVVKDNDDKIASVLDGFDKLTSDFKEISGQLKDANLAGTVKSLEGTLNKFQGILTSIDENKGTLGKLLNDDALYNNLEAASKEMEELLLDIKLHPARYRRILSKKEIPYTPPTEDQKN